jgi:hypothetical protein
MRKLLAIVTVTIFLFTSCKKDSSSNADNLITSPGFSPNNVLLLKVDYTTNIFEGGKELTFANSSSTFTVSNQYAPPGDFGSIKLYYQELNEQLFGGTIIWMGLGSMNFPQSLTAASQFQRVLTNDFVTPSAGFQNVFNPQGQTYNYLTPWASVQSFVKVREYLASNPNATVKIFLYTPSVGVGNPADWDWIILLKN